MNQPTPPSTPQAGPDTLGLSENKPAKKAANATLSLHPQLEVVADMVAGSAEKPKRTRYSENKTIIALSGFGDVTTEALQTATGETSYLAAFGIDQEGQVHVGQSIEGMKYDQPTHIILAPQNTKGLEIVAFLKELDQPDAIIISEHFFSDFYRMATQ